MPRLVAAIALTSVLALGACASTFSSRSSSDRSDRFNAKAVAWASTPGRNAITGTAELTTRRGETKTCAGLEVRLVPDAPYTRDRIALLYGTSDEGFVDAADARRVQTNSEAAVDPAYARTHKVTHCDGKGRFAFSGLADGSYFVLAPVVWKPAGATATDGGFLMQRVRVAGGDTKRLHLAPATRVSAR